MAIKLRKPWRSKSLTSDADVIKSLEFAMPPAIAVHRDHCAYCVEASVVGARVLQRQGIQARAIPVVSTAVRDDGVGTASGYSLAELAAVWPNSTFQGGEFSDTGFHVVIEAFPRGGRMLIDLTAGQLIDSALTLAFAWPDDLSQVFIGHGRWEIEYAMSPRAVEIHNTVIKVAEAASFSGIESDVETLRQAALDCRLDRARFYQALFDSQPELARVFYNVTSARPVVARFGVAAG